MAKEKNAAGTKLCPFSWIKVYKPAGCLSQLFGGGDKEEWEPQPCMKSRCQLWDGVNNDCGLITVRRIEYETNDD